REAFVFPGFAVSVRATHLLNLRFLELDVLAHDGVIALEHKLLRRRARVLLRHVEKAGSSAREQLDFLGDLLGHWSWDLEGVRLKIRIGHHTDRAFGVKAN